MIIRSQSGLMILNFNNILNLYVDGTAICVTEITENDYPIADYSTKEKAIKVLDMIQETYGKHLYGQGGQMAMANYYVPPFAFIPPKVFQMPADEDVEV